MEEMQKLKKRYDHVIIGYNLTSLTFAYELFKKDQNFCVVDSKHQGSSGAKYLSSVDSLVATRVPFNSPFDPQNLEMSPFGEILSNEGTPITFEKGNFKSFLGFGEDKITAPDAVAPFCQTTNVKPQLQAEEFWQKALSQIESHIFLDQQLTDIEYDEEGVTSVTLNGKTQLHGSQFHFFHQFPLLFEKLGNEMKKQASRFGKAKWYSSVNLVIHHENEPTQFEMDQLYLLMGSKRHPCLGQFSRINGHLISRWEAFIPAELTPDSETTGSTFKEIKKQIKRAFFSDQELKGNEHILLHDQVYADLGNVGVDSGNLSHFNNLYVFSPLFSNAIGWANEIYSGLIASQQVDLAPSMGSPSADPSPQL